MNLIKPCDDIIEANLELLELFLADATAKNALLLAVLSLPSQLLKHELHLLADLVDILVFVDLDLLLQHFVLGFDVVNVAIVDNFVVFELEYILIELNPLVRLQIELFISLDWVLALDKHGHLLELMLQIGTLLLKQIVVLLQDAN